MPDRPVIARVAEGGHTLVVFVPGGGRLAVPPGQRLQEATSPELLAGARSLTATERLYTNGGCTWLVQASGPVWSDTAAADSCGLVFTALDGSMRRASLAGLPPGPMPSDEDLGGLLERALGGPGNGDRE